VYWDRETVRLVDGQEMSVSSEDWLPAFLPAPLPAAPVAHRVDLPGGRSVLALPASQTSLPALPETLSLAVILDRSRSMEAHASQMVAVLDRLSVYDSSSTPVDLYLTASSYRGEPPSVVPLDGFKPDEILYFGGQNAAQLLAQFAELRQDQRYDAVIVLTDGSGYELGETDVEVPVPDIPVWIVHLGSDIPLGYDDQTLDAIQASGGGVAGDIEAALERMAVRMAAGPQSGLQDAALDEPAVYQDILDGYLWLVLPTERVDAAVENASNLQSHVSSDPFTALAARRLILAEMQRNRGSIDQLETLDYLHALAKEYGIVTPYSSMIVLVDAQQRRLLEQLSNLDDRFQREVEDIGETVPGSPLPLTGVPEPHEWILLALVAAMLIYLAYTKYWPELAVRTATRRM